MAQSAATITSSSAGPGLQTRGNRLIYRVLVLIGWIVSGWLVIEYARQTRGAAYGAATQIGRIYGLIGAGLFLYLIYYGFRRVSYRTGALSQEFWYRSHLLLGWLAFAMLSCHCWNLKDAFRSPFLAMLQIGYWGTMVTGIYGWVYLTLVRRWMNKHEARPAVRRDLEKQKKVLFEALDAIRKEDSGDQSALTGNLRSEAIDRAVGHMKAQRLTNIWRLPPNSFWEEQIEKVAATLQALPKSARQPIVDLNRIEVLISYHKGLRAWTNVHLVLGGFVVQMMLWHILMVALWPR